MIHKMKGEKDMLDLPLMSNNITKEDVDVLIDFLKGTDRFTNGPKVYEFEQAWSRWLGVKHSVFVNSGASANFMTMAGIAQMYGKGEVIVPVITWVSDISSVIFAGHTPVFVDVDLKNMAMMEDRILEKITEKTKAVFMTHVLGFNALSASFVDTLREQEILLIEDVCESHGVMVGDKKAGSVGFASNFSFYYAHHMSTVEGGVVCTDNDEFYQMMRMFRSHGMLRENTDDAYKVKTVEAFPDLNPEFIFMVPGFNMRSTELNAVIGLNQLRRLDCNIQKRRDNFRVFMEHLNSRRYFTDFDTEGNSNYAFVILLREKDPEFFSRLTDALRKERVEFRRGTAGGGNQARQPFVRKLYPELDPTVFQNAEHIHFYGMYVGNYPDLEKEKILKLSELLNKI